MPGPARFSEKNSTSTVHLPICTIPAGNAFRNTADAPARDEDAFSAKIADATNIGVATGDDLLFFRIEAGQRPDGSGGFIAGKCVFRAVRLSGHIGLAQAPFDIAFRYRTGVWIDNGLCSWRAFPSCSGAAEGTARRFCRSVSNDPLVRQFPAAKRCEIFGVMTIDPAQLGLAESPR